MTDVRIVTLQAALAGMRAIGLADVSLERITGLSKTATQATFVPDTAWKRLWAWAKRYDSDPLLAVRVALAVPPGAFGGLDYFVSSATTLNRALKELKMVFPAISDGTQMIVGLVHPGLFRLRLDIPRQGGPYKDLFTLGLLLGRFSAATGGQFVAERIFVTQGLKMRSACQALFNVPVVLSSARPGFDFSAKWAHLKLATADASLHQALRVQLRTMMSTLVGTPASKALSYAVTDRLWNALGHEPYDLATIAAGLGISSRTLLRRLVQEQTTYQALLRGVRVDVGQTLLAERALSMSSIAQYLGYAEQSAWSRAFRRDVGVSPSEWRARAGLPHGN